METNDQWLERQIRQIWEQLNIQAKFILELQKRCCQCTCHTTGHKFYKMPKELTLAILGEPEACCACPT